MIFLENGIWIKKAIFVTFVAVFTMAFWKNSFNSVEQHWFERHQFDSEALVIGRLGETQLNGLSSYEGRLGTYKLDQQRKGLYTNEDYVYEHEFENGVYRPYNSQIGFQGILFSWLDQGLRGVSTLDAMERKNALHFIASLLTALTVSALLYFILIEFGLFVGVGAAVIALYSQWLIVFGRNLYWVMFFMFLPMVITFYFYQRYKLSTRNLVTMLSLFALSIAIKCACGFEYLTTVVIGALCAVVYFAVKNSWSFLRLLAHLFLVGAASVVGFILTFMLHVYQQSIGDKLPFGDALTIRFVHAAQRLHKQVDDASNELWVKAGEASTLEVVQKYWSGEAFDFGFLLGDPSVAPIHFAVFVIVFAIATPLVLAARDYLPSMALARRRTAALVAVSWLAMSGTLSWYVFAKVHSYFHGHMNHVLWHMPFTLFASAYLLLVAQFVFKDYIFPFAQRVGVRGAGVALAGLIVITFLWKFVSAAHFDRNIDRFVEDGLKLNLSESAVFEGYIAGNDFALLSEGCDKGRRSPVQIETKDSSGRLKLKRTLLEPVAAPMFSSYKGWCIGKARYGSHTPILFSIRVDGHHVGEAEINLGDHNILSSYPLTDGNWSKGIARGFAGFFVENSVINRVLLKHGVVLKFQGSGDREVTRVSVSESYINVSVAGTRLDAELDGYPADIILKPEVE